MNIKKFLTVLALGLAVFAVSCSDDESGNSVTGSGSGSTTAATISVTQGTATTGAGLTGNFAISGTVTGDSTSGFSGIALKTEGTSNYNSDGAVATAVAAISTKENLDIIFTVANLTYDNSGISGAVDGSTDAVFTLTGTDSLGANKTVKVTVSCSNNG